MKYVFFTTISHQFENQFIYDSQPLKFFRYFNLKSKKKKSHQENEINFDRFKKRMCPPMVETVSKQTKDDNMTVEIYLFENNTTDHHKKLVNFYDSFGC